MRIALVSQTASPGLTNFRRELIEDLSELGHTVLTFSNDYSQEEYDLLRKLGAQPIRYPIDRSGLNPIKDMKTFLNLFKLFKEYKIQTCFSFFLKPSLYGSIAAYFARVPNRIFMLEGLGYVYTDTKHPIKLKKVVLRYLIGAMYTVASYTANKVIFLNSDDPVDLSKYAIIQRNKIETLPGIGVVLKKYEMPAPSFVENGLTFLMVSRLLEEKGIIEFIEAAKLLKAIRPDVCLKVAGDFDDKNPSSVSRKVFFEAVEQGAIDYLGYVENIKETLSGSHVLVLPSYREGFPRSIQEAMVAGRVIITTDVPGCREAVINEQTGIIVPPFDAQALFVAMYKLVNNLDRAEKLSFEARKYALANFDVKDANKRLMNILLGS